MSNKGHFKLYFSKIPSDIFSIIYKTTNTKIVFYIAPKPIKALANPKIKKDDKIGICLLK